MFRRLQDAVTKYFEGAWALPGISEGARRRRVSMSARSRPDPDHSNINPSDVTRRPPAHGIRGCNRCYNQTPARASRRHRSASCSPYFELRRTISYQMTVGLCSRGSVCPVSSNPRLTYSRRAPSDEETTPSFTSFAGSDASI